MKCGQWKDTLLRGEAGFGHLVAETRSTASLSAPTAMFAITLVAVALRS